MGKVVMYSSVSVDGFVADENDQPGPPVSVVSLADPLSQPTERRRDRNNVAVTRMPQAANHGSHRKACHAMAR